MHWNSQSFIHGINLQVGPYVFQEQHEKSSIVWNHENGTVTYKQIRTWVYQPHLSNGEEILVERNLIVTKIFFQELWRIR